MPSEKTATSQEVLEWVNQMIPNFSNEIVTLQSTFENLILKESVVQPFLVSYDDTKKKNFVAFVRESLKDDPKDYYSAISSLMFANVASMSTLFTFTVHTKSNQYFNPSKVLPLKNLESIVVFVVDDNRAFAVELPYSINDGKVMWSSDYNAFNIGGFNDPMIECLFIFSHIDESPFVYIDVLKYLSENGYQIMITDESSFANKVFLLQKGIFKY